MPIHNAARRGVRGERENLVAYIHGIDTEGEVAHILVHQRGNNIRLFGRLGAHEFSSSNAGDMDKWISEAEAVWGLEAAIAIPRGWMNSPETLEKIKLLNITAAKKKELALAASLNLNPS